ncbi:MAG: hypothetical protein M1817_005615 [Caeruleum heppii]|nr:MAG: hypothetical protein M1817_005615 [Caeruleum heppii]
MAPNLLVFTQTLFNPRRWGRGKSHNRSRSHSATNQADAASRNNSNASTASLRRTEHWDVPVPGTYEYIPGRGWYLIARDVALNPHSIHSRPTTPTSPSVGAPKPPQTRSRNSSLRRSSLSRRLSTASSISSDESHHYHHRTRERVIWNPIVKRYMLAADFDARTKYARVPMRDHKTGKELSRTETRRFFCLDDGESWVGPWDSEGRFREGPWGRWVADGKTGGLVRGERTDELPLQKQKTFPPEAGPRPLPAQHRGRERQRESERDDLRANEKGKGKAVGMQ